MSRTLLPTSGRPYGLARVCRAWRVARATAYRHRAPPRAEPPRRPGPVGPMPDAALAETIRAVLAASPFHGEGHRKVWARLRHAGVRTSKRRVLRLMGEHDLLAPSRAGSPRGPRSHDGTIIPEAVDAMWGTDLTTTITGEGQAAVFVAVDHCSAECVGLHAARHANRFEALEPIRQGVRRHFGGFAQGIAAGLAVRHDHGSQYMSGDFQKEHASSTSRARPPSSARRRAMAARSASSAPSRKTCSGSGPSTPSRTCGGRCSSSATPTTRPGSSSGTASGHPAPSGRISFQPRHSPHRLQPGVSPTAGGTPSRALVTS